MLGADPTPFLFKFAGLLRNIPALDKAAAALGLDPAPHGNAPRGLFGSHLGGQLVSAAPRAHEVQRVNRHGE